MSGTHSDLLFHIVFSTKNRLPLIDDTIQKYLFKYMGGIIRGLDGNLIEIGGMNDHVHLLVRLRTTHTLSDFMRDTKAGVSKWVNEEKWKMKKFGWQDGYAAFTVSRSQLPRVSRYIQNQRDHHQGFDFKTELITMLDKHEVEYDEQYLWD